MGIDVSGTCYVKQVVPMGDIVVKVVGVGEVCCGDWMLELGELATVVVGDSDEDFRLRNP